MVFWFWVIFLAILFLGFDGILTMIGLIVGLIILFIVVMSFKEYFQDHPDKKKKFQKSLIWMLIIAVITLVAQLVISNVIYNRYHVVYILNKEVSRLNSDYVAGYIEEYEETFLARNDSSAIAKIQPYVMETADELFNSWSNIVGIEVRYIKLNNLTVDKFKDIKPKGIEEKIEKAIRAKYHFPDKIAEPTESDDVSADSINVDTLGFE